MLLNGHDFIIGGWFISWFPFEKIFIIDQLDVLIDSNSCKINYFDDINQRESQTKSEQTTKITYNGNN